MEYQLWGLSLGQSLLERREEKGWAEDGGINLFNPTPIFTMRVLFSRKGLPQPRIEN